MICFTTAHIDALSGSSPSVMHSSTYQARTQAQILAHNMRDRLFVRTACVPIRFNGLAASYHGVQSVL